MSSKKETMYVSLWPETMKMVVDFRRKKNTSRLMNNMGQEAIYLDNNLDWKVSTETVN